MKVKIKKLNEGAKMPFKAHNEDFAYDVVATSCVEVAPNVWKYGIGLAFQIDRTEPTRITKGLLIDGMVRTADLDLNLSIDLRPRSSIYKTGMMLANCTGTIDELYRGEVSAVFYHVMTGMPKYEVGDRIGQIKIGLTFPIEFAEVDELDDSTRGDGGFGSTGK